MNIYKCLHIYRYHCAGSCTRVFYYSCTSIIASYKISRFIPTSSVTVLTSFTSIFDVLNITPSLHTLSHVYLKLSTCIEVLVLFKLSAIQLLRGHHADKSPTRRDGSQLSLCQLETLNYVPEPKTKLNSTNHSDGCVKCEQNNVLALHFMRSPF